MMIKSFMEELIMREFESDMLPGDDEEVLEINGVFDEEVFVEGGSDSSSDTM